LEATLPAPSRKPRNVSCKRVAKKLKVVETTSREVNSSSRIVEYLSLCMLTNEFRVLAGDSAFRPRRSGRRRRLRDGGRAG
jgi:hypothetical protein